MDKIVLYKISALIGLFFGISISAQTVYQKKLVRVEYNKAWTKDSLISIQNRLKSNHNIDIKFENVSYKNDFVDTFKMTIDCNDGYSGYANFTKPVNNTVFGFFRDYKMFSKTQFALGYLSIINKQ